MLDCCATQRNAGQRRAGRGVGSRSAQLVAQFLRSSSARHYHCHSHAHSHAHAHSGLRGGQEERVVWSWIQGRGENVRREISHGVLCVQNSGQERRRWTLDAGRWSSWVGLLTTRESSASHTTPMSDFLGGRSRAAQVDVDLLCSLGEGISGFSSRREIIIRG